jgi:hypothetical protein
MRALVYDRTCIRSGGGLTIPWAAGAGLYRALRRIDRAKGVASWAEAFAWLAAQDQPITEIQYWGHGKWGSASVGRERFAVASLLRNHAHRPLLDAVRARLAPDALVWFRTCETLGAVPGIDFAETLADFLGARVAGHTHIIGFHQSGLHGIAPGQRADWSPDEGLAEGTPHAPVRGAWSRPWAPRTVTCLAGRVPAAWFV